MSRTDDILERNIKLVNYQARIADLEAENAKLKEDYDELVCADMDLEDLKNKQEEELATLKKQVEIAVEALEKISLARHDADIINQEWYWNVADKALQNLNQGKEAV